VPGSVPKGEEYYHLRVFFHTLGTHWKRDKLIFGEGRHKEDAFHLNVSENGEYLAIRASRTWTQSDVYLYHSATGKVISVVENIPAIFSPIVAHGNLFLFTNHRAMHYKVLYAPLKSMPSALKKWKIFIPEDKKAILENISATADFILAQYNKNVASQVKVFDYSGNFKKFFPIPPASTVRSISGNKTEREFFFEIESFLTSGTAYRYSPERKSFFIHHKSHIMLDPKKYSIKQEWFLAKDGTKIPMFIISKNSVRRTGKNPALLYGYGGFKISQKPAFYKSWMPFINSGGIFAVANIRGGEEFGSKWHEAAILKNKQRSFDDFIGAAEWLIKRRYTDTTRLAITGGSNGGLLVTACAIQRPDLFRAVVAQVPLTDMVRFPLYYIASRWTGEYGNPTIEREFKWIMRWSPYHNVKEGTEYPSFLFTTSINDTRVHPMHAWKMAALLQSINSKNPVLLRTQMDAGHGVGTPIHWAIQRQADVLAFLDWRLFKKID
jgi:prolyl oligopeptidase